MNHLKFILLLFITTSFLGLSQSCDGIKHNHQGVKYYELGNDEKALDEFQKALVCYKLNNSHEKIGRGYYNIGSQYSNLGNLEFMNIYLDSALIKGFSKPMVFLLKGHSYRKKDSLEIAEQYYLKAIDLDSLNHESYLYLGHIYMMRSDYEKCLEYSSISVEIKSNWLGHLNKAYCFIFGKMRDLKEAEKEALLASYFHPESSDTYKLWMALTGELEQWNKCKYFINQLKALDEDGFYTEDIKWYEDKLPLGK